MNIKEYLIDPSRNDTLPLRSYYVPYGSEDDTVKPREKSAAVTVFDGLWDFAELKDINDWDGTADFAMTDKIVVPSCVQWQGYDEMQYVNSRYPFPYDPPYIRKANPAFLYRRTFRVTGESKKRYLVFDGVDSSYFLFVNGKMLGYAQVPHRMSEWDITEYVHEGENELFVAVAKWCAGSYLEDQDKWRTSGIFRSVYMLERPRRHIEDYRIGTAIKGNAGIISFTLERGGAAATVKLVGGKPITCEAGKTVEISVPNVKPWNAEEPHLYDLIIECEGEYIRERVGIREVRIENKTILLNGRKFKCKGICRHEFNPVTGATVTEEETRRDLLLIKENNFNAIRTSHYPDIPQFYKLCDEIGIYVISESDLECHGVMTQEGIFEAKHFHDLANSPLYREPILYRQQCSVEREKNRCCVLFWSLGNESGYGDNFENAAEWIHKRDPGRLVHYEGASQTEGTPIYYTDKLDVVSRMYPTPEWMDELKNDEKEHRPMVLCECAHSMGNGPGDISRYWDVIYRNDNLAGAFIWQFADSAPLPNLQSERFKYGGDFGEKLHDGAFVTSGVFDALRREKPPLIEHRVTLQPLKVRDCGGGRYNVKSMLDFATVSVKGAAVVKAGEKKLATVPVEFELVAGAEKTVTVPCDVPEEHKGEYASVRFELSATYGGNTYPAQAAFTLADEAKALPVSDGTPTQSCRAAGKLRLQKRDTILEIDCKTGNILQIYFGEHPVLKEPIEFNVWRAPVDNDAPLIGLWKQWGLDEAVPYAADVRETREGAVIDAMLVTDVRTPQLRYTLEVSMPTYRAIKISVDYRVSDYVAFIPRAGIKFALPKAERKAEYLGNGPCESYSDKCVGAIKDVYRADVKDMFRSYIVPQECGGHNNTDRLTLADGTLGITVRGEKPFEFSVLPYSAAQLQSVKHSWQLPESDADYVCIDDCMTGMGSASCGPAMHDKYFLMQRGGKFTFTLELNELQNR